MKLRQVLASRLRELMSTTPGLDTQVQVAQRSGMAQTTVSRILNCRVAATLDNVESLARIYGITPGDLLTQKPHNLGVNAQAERTIMARLAEFLAVEGGAVTAKTIVPPPQQRVAAIRRAATSSKGTGKPVSTRDLDQLPKRKRAAGR